MTPLEKIIRGHIRADGPMPLADYMALCLAHPEHGYYMVREPIGRSGDFTTAPEISQMFGEIVGAWLAHAWQIMEQPESLNLVELGPGRGTLMADILRTFRLLPDLFAATRVHLVETSPRLRRAQKERLSNIQAVIEWHNALAGVPRGPMLLVANEFFDALPVRQVVRTNHGWRERCVAIGDDSRLALVEGCTVRDEDVPQAHQAAASGAVIESSPLSLAIAAEIGGRLAAHAGAGLIIDYGYREPATGDSLQALRDKRPADPLEAPGEADLTAHVDFSALSRALDDAGAQARGPVAQGSFLTASGIVLRAERLRSAGAPGAEIASALERLTGTGAMGNLFKVLAATTPGLPIPPPFDSLSA